MKKQTTVAFRKKAYLLGADAEGTKYWLEAPSWDCNWYYGFGYIETYSNNNCPEKARYINSHQHFDNLFLSKPKVSAFDAFKTFFKETTLNDNEIWTLLDYMSWTLLDYMRSFYTFKEAAATLGRGYSHITEKAKLEEAKNVEMAKEINEKILPAIFKQIDIMLSGSKEEENGGETN